MARDYGAQSHHCTFEGCARVFKRRDRLEIHQRVHTGEKPFVCDVEGCDKSYSRSQHLARHVDNTHTVKSTYSNKSCPVCKEVLSDKYALQKHLEREHEDKSGSKLYECPESDCEESFHKKKQLVAHRLEHHSEHITDAKKCHKCPFEGCSKVFTWQIVLKRHMKSHQGYPCKADGCETVCPNWSSLRKHMAKDHQKEYACHECGVQFSRKPNLTQHMKRKHKKGSAVKHACPAEGCGRVYDYKNNLNLHIREYHEGDSIWKKKPKSRVKQRIQKKKKSTAAKLCGLDDSQKIQDAKNNKALHEDECMELERQNKSVTIRRKSWEEGTTMNGNHSRFANCIGSVADSPSNRRDEIKGNEKSVTVHTVDSNPSSKNVVCVSENNNLSKDEGSVILYDKKAILNETSQQLDIVVNLDVVEETDNALLFDDL